MPYTPVKSPLEDTVIGYQRTSDGAFIPIDPDNMDYRAVLQWLAENPPS